MSLTDPILSAIGTAVGAATPVHDAHVPRRDDGTPLDVTYVVVYPDLGVLSSPALCGDLVASDVIYRLVYVGPTRTIVEKLCGAVRDAILERSFTDGTWLAEFDPDDFHQTTPVTWNEDIADRVVMSATDEFRALAQRV